MVSRLTLPPASVYILTASAGASDALPGWIMTPQPSSASTAAEAAIDLRSNSERIHKSVINNNQL